MNCRHSEKFHSEICNNNLYWNRNITCFIWSYKRQCICNNSGCITKSIQNGNKNMEAKTAVIRIQRVNVPRSEEHTSELQSRFDLVCRLLLEKKKHTNTQN